MRYLGIDYGSKKVGIALSDEGGTMGFPHAVVRNSPRLMSDLIQLIAEEKVGAVVIGESRTLLGDENPVAKDARAFSEKLQEQTNLPIFFESEVFTTAEARRSPHKEGKSRAVAARQEVDASAAAIILTSYLSRHHG